MLLFPGFGYSVPTSAITDAQGHFDLPQAPAGKTVVICSASSMRVSDSVAQVVVPQGGEVQARVLIVPNLQGDRPGNPGFLLNPVSLTPRVLGVDAGSAAQSAGVKPGDLVVAVDGRSVEGLGADAVSTLIGRRPTGSHVAVAFARGGAPATVQLTVGPPRQRAANIRVVKASTLRLLDSTGIAFTEYTAPCRHRQRRVRA